MVQRRRAFSGLAGTGEPFDWPGFFKTLHLQPVPLWIALGLFAGPVARTLPPLTRAVCADRPRATLISLSEAAYVTLAAPALALLAYALLARRRLAGRQHRLVGDLSAALLAVVSLWQATVFLRRAAEIAPALAALRAACWP